VGKEVAMMWGNHWMFGGYMWVVWLVVLIGLVYLFKAILGSPNKRTEDRADTPLAILEKRYARGDISKEEFTERKKALSA
jgi:putative membrane protein